MELELGSIVLGGNNWAPAAVISLVCGQPFSYVDDLMEYSVAYVILFFCFQCQFYLAVISKTGRLASRMGMGGLWKKGSGSFVFFRISLYFRLVWRKKVFVRLG
jgi:hypothetical protein